MKKTLFVTIILLGLLLSACSNTKQGMATLGSLVGVIYATSKDENVFLGSLAGGAIGSVVGQVATQVQISK